MNDENSKPLNMSESYIPKLLEETVQNFWEKHHYFKTDVRDLQKEKAYILSAFPYPSGELHVGHVRNYVLGDAIARYQRALGKQVLHPMGWDAFGLPAENAARQKNVEPSAWTYANIENMRQQLKRLGLSYDWDRELATCDPEYYRWEQWVFTKLFEKGLAYRKTSWVNWDPVDQTILANEQVIKGRGWRSGAVIERRAIPQWFLKISEYAQPLLDDLEKLSKWPHAVKVMQKNWIGRSEGVIVKFSMVDQEETVPLEIFTTRVDTIMGVTYLALAPEHAFSQKISLKNTKIDTFIKYCRTLPTTEAAVATQTKEGVFTEHYARHPITQQLIPIWVTNFVTADYGTGAVMAVPAHDSRDFEFAKKYQLPIQRVIGSADAEDELAHAYLEPGILIHSGRFTGLASKEAKHTILEYLTKYDLGYATVHYRLKDWCVSRQRYWGAPIPIVYCEDCGMVPVPEQELPVVLPKTVEIQGGPVPLAQIPEFYQTTCPRCHQAARRETDTFDTFLESSWYFLRFTCSKASEVFAQETSHWLPVDTYVIGVEHAILHLLYSRFFYKLLGDCELLKIEDVDFKEPFKKVLTQGMVLKDGAKMSKSKGNVVNPIPLIEKYGADAMRLFILFAAPPEQSLEWSEKGIVGAHRFLNRLWHFVHHELDLNRKIDSTKFTQLTESVAALRMRIHQLLKDATKDYEQNQFNTVIAKCMTLLNTLQASIPLSNQAPVEEQAQWQPVLQEGTKILITMLSPVAPHLCHVLWQKLYSNKIAPAMHWPQVDDSILKMSKTTVIVQIDGKKRVVLERSNDMTEEHFEADLLNNSQVQSYLTNRTVRKIIKLPAKSPAALLINIVTGAVL